MKAKRPVIHSITGLCFNLHTTCTAIADIICINQIALLITFTAHKYKSNFTYHLCNSVVLDFVDRHSIQIWPCANSNHFHEVAALFERHCNIFCFPVGPFAGAGELQYPGLLAVNI